jgi:hypothetical protein
MMLANRSAVVQSINQMLGRRHIRAPRFVAAIVLLALGAVASPANAQTIIYVNAAAAAAGGNGESWERCTTQVHAVSH